jgi:D-alanine-D-alanine ligase
MEIVYRTDKIKTPYPVYSYEYKLDPRGEIENQAPAQMSDALRKDVEQVARDAFSALGCRDFARIDVRLNAEGKACFIECNPLPGLTPKWSDLCLISDSVGMDYTTLIAELLSPSIRRWREKRRQD